MVKKTSTKLLLDEQPLIILPGLACKIGLNESIVVQQVHYWLEVNRKLKRNIIAGRVWCYNSIKKWQEKNFAFWHETTVKRVFQSALKMEVLIKDNFNKRGYDRTAWYTINYELLGVTAPLEEFNPELAFPDGKPDPEQPDIFAMHDAKIAKDFSRVTEPFGQYDQMAIPG